MTKKDKSVLDNMPTKEHGFPLGSATAHTVVDPSRLLEIIGQCPNCSSPIYGKKSITADEVPIVKHTCGCMHATQHNPKNFGDTICTK